MWNDVYLESRVLSADPVDLIAILYEGALGAVEQARRRLAEGDIAGRATAVSKAVAILAELSSALDHSSGGEISTRLARLYDYMQRRLLEGNFRQEEEPLGEVARLLRVLAEGWNGIRETRQAAKPAPVPHPAPSPWGDPYIAQPANGYAGQGWSF